MFRSTERPLCRHPPPLILRQLKEEEPYVTLAGHAGIYGVFVHICSPCQNTDRLLGARNHDTFGRSGSVVKKRFGNPTRLGGGVTGRVDPAHLHFQGMRAAFWEVTAGCTGSLSRQAKH